MAESLVVRLDERLDEAGQALELTGTLAADDFVVGDRDFRVPDGIAYDLTLANTGGEILVTGSASATLEGECDRCLGPATLELTGEVEALYSPDGSDFEPGEEDGLETLPIEEDAIDLTGPVLQAVAVEIPFKVLCREDCKGLCPVCGQNLNEADCGHLAEREAASDPMNPFSVLKDYKFGEEVED